MHRETAKRIAFIAILAAIGCGVLHWILARNEEQESKQITKALTSYAPNRVYRVVFDVEEAETSILNPRIEFTYNVSIEELYEVKPGEFTNLSELISDDDRFSELIISQNPVHGQTMGIDEQKSLLNSALIQIEKMSEGESPGGSPSLKRRAIYKEALGSKQILVMGWGDNGYDDKFGFIYWPISLPILPDQDLYEWSENRKEWTRQSNPD